MDPSSRFAFAILGYNIAIEDVEVTYAYQKAVAISYDSDF